MDPVWIQFPRLSQYLVTFSVNNIKKTKMLFIFSLHHQRATISLHAMSNIISCILRTHGGRMDPHDSCPPPPDLPRVLRQLVSQTPPPQPRSAGGVPLVTGFSGGSASSKKNKPSSRSYPLSPSIFFTSRSVFGDRHPSASLFLPFHHPFVCLASPSPPLFLLLHLLNHKCDLTLDSITHLLLHHSFLIIYIFLNALLVVAKPSHEMKLIFTHYGSSQIQRKTIRFQENKEKSLDETINIFCKKCLIPLLMPRKAHLPQQETQIMENI